MKILRNQTYRICLRWLSSTLYIWIFKYSFALVKLPLFSRNGPQTPPPPLQKKKRNSWAVLNRTIPFAQAVYRGAFLDWENQSNHRGKSKGRKIPLRTNEISKLKQSNCLKREKTRVTKSWLVLVLHLISWESDSSFLDQWQSKKKRQKQRNPALLSTLNWKLLSWSVLSVTLENKS